MPGYGFSGKPTTTGWDPAHIARAWVVLMRRLGYTKFVAQGGDWGAIITDVMATQGHPELLGIHTNMPGVFSADIDKAALAGAPAPSALSADEKLAYERLAFVYAKGIGYGYQMGLRPQTLYGIADSPVGIAGYFLDHDARSLAMISRSFDGQPEGLTRDDVLDNVTLTWLTNTFISGARLYWEASENKISFFGVKGVSIPVAVSVFPDELYPAPRSWAEQAYPKSSITTSSREAGISPPGNSRCSLPKSFARASDRSANRPEKVPHTHRNSAHRMSDHSMKRTYFPGITDIVVVTDPAEIRTISNNSRFDRDFIGHGPVRNVQRLRKMLRIFSLNGRLFPTMLPRTNPSRAAAQDELWSRLNVKADEVKHGPAQLEPLAEWVRGIGTAEKLGLLVQQSIGRLFVETFTATEESLAAARMVLEAASSSNVLKMLGWRISGRLERAKTLLASMVNGDLAGVIAIIAARQLIVDGLHKMRQLAADPALRSSITTDAAVDECLFAPTAVVRQAKTSGEVGGCPFRRGSLFILGLGSASKGAANRDLVFLSQSWSRCPAEKWVPALLEGVWTRVSATLHEFLKKPRGPH